MGAKRSAQTEYALRLVRGGSSIAHASRKAGVYWSTVKRALQADEAKSLNNQRKIVVDTSA